MFRIPFKRFLSPGLMKSGMWKCPARIFLNNWFMLSSSNGRCPAIIAWQGGLG